VPPFTLQTRPRRRPGPSLCPTCAGRVTDVSWTKVKVTSHWSSVSLKRAHTVVSTGAVRSWRLWVDALLATTPRCTLQVHTNIRTLPCISNLSVSSRVPADPLHCGESYRSRRLVNSVTVYRPFRRWQFDGAHPRRSCLANASEAAPATASLPFGHFCADQWV